MPSTHNGQYPGFAIAHAVDGAGKHYPVARFACNSGVPGCTQTLDRTIKSGEMNPEMIAKWARRRGWVVISGRPGHVTCPDCASANPLDKALEDFISRTTGDENMAKPIQTTTTASPPEVTPEVTQISPLRTLHSLSTEQRIQIRHLLEKNFDEELGYYVGGYSDEKIAEELGIPRVLVERAREYAYGPIKVTQAQLDARRRFEELTTRIATLEEFGREFVAQYSRDVMDLRKELDMLKRDAAA